MQEIPVDLPSSTSGTSLSPSVLSPSTAAPFKDAGDDVDMVEIEGDKSDAEDEGKESKGKGNSWWDFIVDKVDDAKDWLSDLFGSKEETKEDEDERR